MVFGLFGSKQKDRPAAGQNGASTANGTNGASAPSLSIPSDKIAQRAYDIWVSRGRPDGTAQEDWLTAESQLRAEMQGDSPDPRRPR